MANEKDSQRTQISGDELRKLLVDASGRRIRIRLFFPPEGPAFSSNLVHVYDSQLLMDGVGSPAIRRLLEQEVRLEAEFSFRRTGVFRFSTYFATFKDHVSEQFLVELPAVIDHVQRRGAYRVEPSRTLSATVMSIGGKATHDRVRIENISISGMCLSFPQQAAIKVGSLLRSIRIHLQDLPEFVVDGVVRSITRAEDGRFRLGVEWWMLEVEQEKILKHFISACQIIEVKTRH